MRMMSSIFQIIFFRSRSQAFGQGSGPPRYRSRVLTSSDKSRHRLFCVELFCNRRLILYNFGVINLQNNHSPLFELVNKIILINFFIGSLGAVYLGGYIYILNQNPC